MHPYPAPLPARGGGLSSLVDSPTQGGFVPPFFSDAGLSLFRTEKQNGVLAAFAANTP